MDDIGATLGVGCLIILALAFLIFVGGARAVSWVTDALASFNDSEADRISAEASRLEARADLVDSRTASNAQQARDDRASYMLYSTTLAVITHDPLLWVILGVFSLLGLLVFSGLRQGL